MTAHLYECPTPPNKGVRIVLPDRPNGFGGVVPGSIWCWRHGQWEGIPEAWRYREALLRDAVLQEWLFIQRKEFAMSTVEEPVREYCAHRGWRVPDFTDRYAVLRFIADLREIAGVRL